MDKIFRASGRDYWYDGAYWYEHDGKEITKITTDFIGSVRTINGENLAEVIGIIVKGKTKNFTPRLGVGNIAFGIDESIGIKEKGEGILVFDYKYQVGYSAVGPITRIYKEIEL